MIEVFGSDDEIGSVFLISEGLDEEFAGFDLFDTSHVKKRHRFGNELGVEL